MNIKKLLVLITIIAIMSFVLTGCDSPNPTFNEQEEPSDLVYEEQEQPDLDVEEPEPIVEEPEQADSDFDEQGRDNLIPMNHEATASISNAFADNHVATLSIDEVVRGEVALDYINARMEGSLFEAAPPADEDYEYVVVRITYTLVSAEGITELSPSRMRSYSGDFEAYPTLIAATFFNDTDFVHLGSLDVQVGETVTAYMIFVVHVTDMQPMMTYESMSADGSDGLWFKLH